MESKTQEPEKSEPFNAYLAASQEVAAKQEAQNREHAETVMEQTKAEFQSSVQTIPEGERKKPLPFVPDPAEVAKAAEEAKGNPADFKDKKTAEITQCVLEEKTHVAVLEKNFNDNGGNLPVEADAAKPEETDLDNMYTSSIKPPQFDESATEEPQQNVPAAPEALDVPEVEVRAPIPEPEQETEVVPTEVQSSPPVPAPHPTEEPAKVPESKSEPQSTFPTQADTRVEEELQPQPQPELAPISFDAGGTIDSHPDVEPKEKTPVKKEPMVMAQESPPPASKSPEVQKEPSPKQEEQRKAVPEPEDMPKTAAEPELKPEELPKAATVPEVPETRPEVVVPPPVSAPAPVAEAPAEVPVPATQVQEGVVDELPPADAEDTRSPITPEKQEEPAMGSISSISPQPQKQTAAGAKRMAKEEEKALETRNMIEMIERMMENPDEAGSEQAEDMILELHKLITHTNGNIPINFKAKLAAFASNISPAITRPPAKKATKTRPAAFSADLSQQEEQKEQLPEYLQKDMNDSSVVREYHELMDNYNAALYWLSAKTIADFRADIGPTKATVHVGFALALLLKELDASFIVDASRRAANSKLWSVAQQCLSKAGYVAQLMKRVTSFVESDKCQYDKLEQAIAYYLDVTSEELAECKKKETVYIHSYMTNVVKYIAFVARTKEYGKKVLAAKRAKEEKDLQRERAKERAIKGTGAQAGVIKEIIKTSPRQMTNFETKVNMMVYEEGEKAGEELRKAEKVIEDKRKYIKELDRKKKNLLHQMEKERVEKKRKLKEEDAKNYREYQQELRDRLRIFLADKIKEDTTYRSQMLNEHLFYAKVVKLKALSEQKKRWLDEFQKTLGWIEFNQKLAGMKAEEKQKIHKEFIEKMMIDKEYSREIYLAQKLLEHEERVGDRNKDVQFQESQLQKEQTQLEDELEYLYKCSKK